MSISSPERNGGVALVVSGGPAPGINSVISACTIEARKRGLEVFGLRNGFKGVTVGEAEAVVPLTIEQVSTIARSGGSILGTSRFSPFTEATREERFVRELTARGIDKVIVIGGEGSAWLSHQLALRTPLAVVHVPKTIDNDLILPNHYPSFGFETARAVGTTILETLMVDARTCRRWFLVTTMGRRAGFLALGLGLASGATMTLIPEEFRRQSQTPLDIARFSAGSIRARAAAGRPWGIALLAEGLLDSIDLSSSPVFQDLPRDHLGRIQYSHLELGDIIAPEVHRLCGAELELPIITKNIGYELRCHAPVSFDLEYTKFLGFGAVKLLAEGQSDIMVTRDFDTIGAHPLAGMLDANGQMHSRTVDLNSDLYRVARGFMIRPEPPVGG